MAKFFDLNIDKVLENWTIAYALREIIANAIDEQTITNTQDIQITKDSTNNWHIRDFGRGLQYKHLIQNENAEKLENPNLIGKFGVGLKDALAVFDRHNIKISIVSKYGKITLTRKNKSDFDDVITLHACLDETPIDMIGTDIIISGCDDFDIEEAKNLFLRFKNMKLLDKNKYGEIYKNTDNGGCVFINGVMVAEENNFMFSYNITEKNAKIRKALNRERSNVGRTAYADSIKAILLNCKSPDVIIALSNRLNSFASGSMPDELTWSDVSAYIVREQNKTGNVVYMTINDKDSLSNHGREIIEQSGKQIVYVSDDVFRKIESVKDSAGNEIATISKIISEYNDTFEYKFISKNSLNNNEQNILYYADWAFDFMKANYLKSKLEISEKLRPDIYGNSTLGVWDKSIGKIVILRNQLQTLDKFLGTLIHEIVHATGQGEDLTRQFENILTNTIGILAEKLNKS